MTSLREALADWTDIDDAEHFLALCLGIAEAGSTMRDYKAAYWSDNPTGNTLAHILDRLVGIGVLEKRTEPDFQYRNCPDESHSRA
jgi:hypothetical protein